jgi:hypothetical protein
MKLVDYIVLHTEMHTADMKTLVTERKKKNGH